MGKLTPEKYALTCALMKLGFDIHSGNEHLVFDAAKAYAAAQVAAKDAEIARLQIEVENLKSYQQSLECDNFHANAHADTFEAEIAALKADNARMREGVATQVDRLHKLHNNSSTLSDDDCEWLRSIAKELNALLSPADGGEQWIGDMSNESFDKWLRILKKMGELTVREDGGTPFKIKSVDGLYTGADCVNDTLNDVIDWVSRHGGLEFLVPTYEGVKSICTKCEAPIEACECEFEDDYEANSHTRRSPADGDGVEETSAGGNMENPSFLIGAKCDDGEPVSLHIHHGNNGDFYPEIRYKDKKDGNWRRSPSPRISTSGGHNGPEILIAIANLYRALAGRGIEG